MMWWRGMMLCLVLLCVSAPGCEISPQDASSSGPVKECVSAGQQCRYAKGKLGVCQFNDAQELLCMSQH